MGKLPFKDVRYGILNCCFNESAVHIPAITIWVAGTGCCVVLISIFKECPKELAVKKLFATPSSLKNKVPVSPSSLSFAIGYFRLRIFSLKPIFPVTRILSFSGYNGTCTSNCSCAAPSINNCCNCESFSLSGEEST